MEDDLKETQKAAMERFQNELSDKGVSFIRTDNGDMLFAFKRTRLEEFIKTMDDKGSDQIIVLIQSSQTN